MRPRTAALLLQELLFWILILLPFDFRVPHSVGSILGAQIFYLEHAPGTFALELVKSITHAVLFLPLAPIVAAGRTEPLRRIFGWKLCLLVFLRAAGSELLQLTVSRGTSVPDFLMDLLGFLAGLLAVKWWRRSERVRKAFTLVTSPSLLIFAALLLNCSLFVLAAPREGLPFGPGGLSAWDPRYPLTLGAERTKSGPWSGVVESLEVRAGEGEGEVVLSYPLEPGDLESTDDGRVAVAHGKLGPDLVALGDLAPHPASPRGVEFRPLSFLTTPGSPSDAIERLRASGAFSVVVRLRTGPRGQWGPARIVTCSRTSRFRNFSLAQDGRGLEFRVCTPITGTTGLQGGMLRALDCLPADQTVEVKASYARGVLRLFVDGKLLKERQVSLLDWLSHHGFGSPFNRRVELGLALVYWGLTTALFWPLLLRRGWSHRHALPAAAALAVLTLSAAIFLSFPRAALAAR